MKIADAASSATRPHEKGYRPGKLDNRILLKGQEGEPDNYKFNVGQVESAWSTPRHKHDFDQLRYPLEGEFIYAEGKSLPAGWVAYFPAGVHYGPQLRKDGLKMVLCQFGGADGAGFVSTAQREVAVDILRKRGTFANGIFTYRDADGKIHNQDAGEAVREEVVGHPIRYPNPRYDDIIVMNPENYNWIERPGAPGVADKWLGTFTERGTRVGFIRLDADAIITGGTSDAREILFLTRGQVECQGKSYAKHTAFGFEPLEGTAPIRAVEPSEFYCIRLPKFDKAAAAA